MLVGLVLQGCGYCPDPVSIEFGKGTSLLYMVKPVNHYHIKGQNVIKYLAKKHLQFQVELEKFENKKDENYTDKEVLEFVKSDIKGKIKYHSKHTCV